MRNFTGSKSICKKTLFICNNLNLKFIFSNQPSFQPELLLKSSHPKTKSDLFTNAHQILPLELTAPSSTWKYFAVSKNNTNFITIVRYGGPNNNLTQVHQVLPERGLLNMAVFYGHVNPLIKKKFFAAGGMK